MSDFDRVDMTADFWEKADGFTPADAPPPGLRDELAAELAEEARMHRLEGAFLQRLRTPTPDSVMVLGAPEQFADLAAELVQIVKVIARG